MKVPKEIADKVKIYQEGQKAFEEVVEWLRENTGDDVFIEDVFIGTSLPGMSRVMENTAISTQLDTAWTALPGITIIRSREARSILVTAMNVRGKENGN